MAVDRFVLCLFAAAAVAAAAMAQSTTTTRQTFFPATALGNEEMRVHVTNIAATPANGPAPLCAGSISFIDASGNTVGAPTSFNVASGQTFSATVKAGDPALIALFRSGGRPVIRSVVELTITPESVAPCVLITSMEKYELSSTGTDVFISGGTLSSGLVGFRRMLAGKP